MSVCLLSRRMDTYISIADPSVLLCLSMTAAFGIITFYKTKKNQVEKKCIFARGLLLLLLLGILCFATLKSYVGLILFSMACLICYIYLSVQTMLPVDNKAVLITVSVAQKALESNFIMVYIAPVGGIPLTRFAAYGASKAALSMFSGVMRQELAKWGIKVAAVHPGGFRTCIQGTSELWAKQEKHLLENLTPDVKKDYGEDYIEALKNFLLHMPVHCASDLSPVLDDVLHALSAKSPHGLYTPGKSSYLALCIFCYFPLWLYDLFIGKMQSNKSVPSALRASEAKNKNT
ncbi:estradiol 17-beta-dehydrogenase 2-like [Terrapene carolina triunguis]|uniref:estradiol 17-beta-dehydrogenase 2-like n=1 Tax=Terrapene triunguis TaxID=2587831 RepID=UPI000E77A8BB|nr:estradiol 17-beta-dehydrogenase 2-like [Terrapene carolina triunguis]XP_026519502.1 estradiol 17-beta-dehydrogenase 2-like [Terrapene carolina triunguis]